MTIIPSVDAQASPTIKITKDTTDGDGSFNFTIFNATNPANSTALNIPDTSINNMTTPLTVQAGSYSVVETVPLNWNLISSDCLINGIPDGDTLNFAIIDGDTVECIYENTFAPPPCTDTFILNWYSDCWDNRKRIVIDHDMVSGDSNLDDFAVLVSVTDSDLTAARVDGNDIIFTDSDGITVLPHEIESWNDNTGELIAWIGLDKLSYKHDTDFFIYYNNTAQITSLQDIQHVWNTNYKLVSHLHDDFLDSTINNSDGTNNGSIDISGKIADAQDFDGSDSITVANESDFDFDITDPFSISLWFSGPSDATQGMLVTKKAGWTDAGYSLRIFDDGRAYFVLDVDAGIAHQIGSSTVVSDTAYHHIVATYDGSANFNGMKIYIDGSLEATGPDSPITDSTLNDLDVVIGAFNSGVIPITGQIDELHISNTARSAGWISTEYNNQNSPGTFYSIGNEETAP